MSKNNDNLILSGFDFRILVLMPTGRDASLVCQLLESCGLAVGVCDEVDDIATESLNGVGAILLAEEALWPDRFGAFVETVEQQPVWSDIPVVLLAADERSSESLLDTIGTHLNITILDRPLQKAVLTSAMRGALRARQRQYQTRDLLFALKETDRQKDLFLATLSHELRTPLNSMLGWLQMLKGEGNGYDKAHALDVIERNAKAQTQIIDDILTLSRVVTGKLEIDSKLIDLNEVLRTAVDVVKPLLEEKQLTVQLSFEHSAGNIRGDFERLTQVFWNLLSNAIKFTPEHGHIGIELRRAGSFARVTVTDDGKGMKEDFLPYAFERFRQADSSYTRSVGGLGLGLAIVRNIVEHHGGSVSVESPGEGLGSTFAVKLPLAKEVVASDQGSEMSTQSPQNQLTHLRVLLVEDDADGREMLSVMLKQHRIQVQAVPNATEALAAIEKEPPSLLISDLGMPDMDGYTLIEKVRELSPENGGRIPAIALTGYVSKQDRERALRAGFQAHQPKPIDFDELIDTIKKLSSNSTPVENRSIFSGR